MRTLRIVVPGLVVVACLSSACGGRDGVRCEDQSRYATSDSIPPVRVPDDLSVPDESDSLTIPPGAGSRRSASPEGCLESPPDFFDDDEEEEDGG